MNKGKYLRSSLSDREIVSVFKNKSGNRVVLYKVFEPVSYYYIVVSNSYRTICDLISGLPDEEEAEYYLRDIEKYTKRIKDKTTRRYFLRLVRSLPLHQGKLFGDFMFSDGRVDWENIKKYEQQFPGWETRIKP